MGRGEDEQDLGAWSSRDAVEAWQRSGAARNATLAAATERMLDLAALRSGGPGSLESWQSLGAPGRKIVSAGAEASTISRTIGREAAEPIRVYAAKSGSRTLEDTVDAVIAELDRTDAWDREVLVLFTGTGTGWLQEWSLSAIDFLTGGNCATA